MYQAILNGIETQQPIQQPQQQQPTQSQQPQQQQPTQSQQQITPVSVFDIDDFIKDVSKKSEETNRRIHQNSISISSYDIASNCIRETIFKLLNYPVQDYRSTWLPVTMRASLGNSIHDFIQDNSTVFTETEASLKVPSIRCSVRLDCLINDDVLVEIKSCPYGDYSKIINSQRPRTPDFYQTIFYRWMLHNHLQEAKEQPRANLRSDPPKLNKYNINKIQFIYVAHDIVSSDSKSMSESIKTATNVRKLLNSKKNPFAFMTVLTLDLNVIDPIPYENYVVEKLNTINYHLTSQTIPTKDSKFVTNSCFFCLYKNVCKSV